MNHSRIPETPLGATYMTQDEASEVMQLWSDRQREESARMSLVTIHDVAEAIQVAPEHVNQLLQEVRGTRVQGKPRRETIWNRPISLPGGQRVWAAAGVSLIPIGLYLTTLEHSQPQGSAILIFVCSALILTVCAALQISRWVERQAIRIAARSGFSAQEITL